MGGHDKRPPVPYIRGRMSDEVQLKRLLYRAHHRGFKEADLLLGAFADSCLNELSPEELVQFEDLIVNEQDQDIYDWAIGAAEVPPHHDNSVMARLKAFNFPARAAWHRS